MPQSRRFSGIVMGLVLVMVASAFALGVGVTGLLDEDAPAAERTARGSVITAESEGAPAAGALATPSAVDRGDRGSRFGLLDEVYQILNNDFVEPDRVNLDNIRIAAIDGVVESLNDPHSVYIDEETFRLSSEDISGAFEGIGATVNLQGEEIVISGTFRGSPAEAAGIRSGDVILSVDGESTEGWSLQLAVARIRGERGTLVIVGVRHRDAVEEVLEITRDRIIVPSVQSIQIQDREGEAVTDIGYILISQFTARTQSELAPFLEATKNAGLEQLIVDLRGNPGGLLTATVDTVGEFIDGGLVLTEVDREGQRRAFSAQRGGNGVDLTVVLLVNGGSASGSEVMAAALQDHGRGVVIGEQTLGKGTVNIPRGLSDGSVLYVSIARWLTPNGELIEGMGVIPDIIVEPTDEDFQARRDVQLFAAIDFLRGQRGESASGLGG